MKKEPYADSTTSAVGKRLAYLVSEAAKLIEQGFDYVCDVDGVKLFRKRK